MRVLIAEDDMVSRRLLEAKLTKWGFEVLVTEDGLEAWEILQQEDAPRLAVLDWMMPEMAGVDVCRAVRQLDRAVPPYIILLTAKGQKEDIVAGLDAGADDYVTKPFDQQELHGRMRAGKRIVELQEKTVASVNELQASLALVKQLKALLPICMYCKQIRDDDNEWHRLESYIAANSEATFSHGICPHCMESEVKTQLASV